jgi:hypothetical protein
VTGGDHCSARTGFSQQRRGSPPFAFVTLLRIHFLQQWFCNLLTLGMNETLYDAAQYFQFSGHKMREDNLPDDGAKRKVLVEKHIRLGAISERLYQDWHPGQS